MYGDENDGKIKGDVVNYGLMSIVDFEPSKD